MVKPSVPTDFNSDGCTFPFANSKWRLLRGINKVLRKILGADIHAKDCREHDFLRRHKVVHWFKSNWLLFRRIWDKSIAGKFQSPFYLLFTTVSYPWYDKTQPLLKPEWQAFADRYN